MRVIDFLSSQLDREVMEHEKNGGPSIFVQSLDFWQLCIECRSLLLEEKSFEKPVANGGQTDKPISNGLPVSKYPYPQKQPIPINLASQGVKV